MLTKRLHYLLRPDLEGPEEHVSEKSPPFPGIGLRQGLKWGLHHRGPILLLVGVTLLLLLASPDQSLMAFDEGVYAQQAHWMLARGDWVTVGWWGTPDFSQAIGFPWLLALSLHWFGQAEWTVRLPSMLACWGAVLLTWRLGQTLSITGAIWGAAILAVLPLWMQASKWATPDVLLAGLGLSILWALLQAEASPSNRAIWGFLVGLILNAYFLVGGTLVLLPLLALMPYLIQTHRRYRHLTNPGLYWGLGLGIGPTLIWLSAAVSRYGWRTVSPLFQLPFGSLTDTITGSMAQPLLGHTSIFYYVWHVPGSTVPWILLVPIGGVLIWRNSLHHHKLLWLGYPLIYIALLSLVHQRSDVSALPIYPFLALGAGVGLDHLARLLCSPRPRHYRVAVGFGWALGVLALLLLSAGGSLIITPEAFVPQDIKLYGWLGIVVGLGWLIPWLLTVNRQVLAPSGSVRRWVGGIWQLGWLLGPAFAISTIFLTGLWGDYTPDLKAALQNDPVASILEEQVIHFIQPRQDPEAILLSFYTPHLGKRYSNWQDVLPGEYAWGDGQFLPLPDSSYQVIGEVEGWQLVRVPPST